MYPSDQFRVSGSMGAAFGRARSNVEEYLDSQFSQLKVMRGQLVAWLSQLKEYWNITIPIAAHSRGAFGPTEQPIEEGNDVTFPYCRHSLLRKVVTHILHRLQGRTRDYGVSGLCPVCGLLPKGDRTVEYVLRVGFRDGDVYHYSFRSGIPERCFRIHDGVIDIYMRDMLVTYSMDVVCSTAFRPHIIPADPPEVVEAERILADQAARRR